jgi:hypothetical protein
VERSIIGRIIETVSHKLSLSREIRISDFLTATTILISLVSVLISWNIDRKIRLAKEADDIRAAAASSLGELERWNDLSLSLYTEAQSTFVDASEVATRIEMKSPLNERLERARDLLWKRLNEIHTSILRKAVDERIDSGYIKLFGYYPSIRRLYQETLARMRLENDEMLKELLTQSELSIMSFMNANDGLHSAEVGSALRATASQVKAKYKEKYRTEMMATERFLVEKIEADDKHLLNRKER